ncbi:MAG TPA: hypothetical protein VGI57_15560, partial [Usitatibacter sp.]
MSKLYDQLKKAALERKARRSSSPNSGPSGKDLHPHAGKDFHAKAESAPDAESNWREEIRSKLQEAERDLHHPAVPDAEELRERESTMATLAEAAQRRAEEESRALLRAQDRAEAERALHAQSEALLQADLKAAQAASARAMAERTAIEKARHREEQEHVRDA